MCADPQPYIEADRVTVSVLAVVDPEKPRR
jgi:hypothetical protein